MFKGLFGKKNEQNTADETSSQFDREWNQVLNRFKIIASVQSFDFKLRHPRTGKIMEPHAGMGKTFKDWKQIQSAWDRRRLLLTTLVTTVYKGLKIWQIANLMTAIGDTAKALETLQLAPTPAEGDEDYTQHCAAYARAYLGRHQADEALEWAHKASESTPTDIRIQIVLADALALTGDWEKANAIYSVHMNPSTAATTASSSDVDQVFTKFFALETGSVPSPVFALEIANRLNQPAQAEEFWLLAETEFYDSPYFRMHHAYHLANMGATERCLAKLTALVQEMPWLREPALNLDILLKQLDPTGTKIMPEFQRQLRDTIQANGWTTEGMKPMQIGK